MRKYLLYIAACMLALILAACSNTQANPAADQAPTATASIPGGESPPEMNPEPVTSNSELTQVILGILKLEGTDQAISAEQAAKLLQIGKELSETIQNGNSSQEQIDGLLEQIRTGLTAEQIQAITDMQFTREDMVTTLQEQGISMGGGQPNAGEGERGGQPPQGGDAGAPPASAIPPGGGQPPANDQAPNPPAAGERPARGFVSPELVNAFLQFLEEKTGSQ